MKNSNDTSGNRSRDKSTVIFRGISAVINTDKSSGRWMSVTYENAISKLGQSLWHLWWTQSLWNEFLE
jgi:hypothetical protein